MSVRDSWGFNAASREVHLGPAVSWIRLLSSLAVYQLAADPVVASYTVTCPALGSWM